MKQSATRLDRRATVLTKAVARAADQLQVNRATLAAILGLSLATISRMYASRYALHENRKEWELGALFVRMHRSLSANVGTQAMVWLTNDNKALGDKPIEMIRTAQGLVRVIQYLDTIFA